MRTSLRAVLAAAAVVLALGWNPVVAAACGTHTSCDSSGGICVVSAGDACVSDTVMKKPYSDYDCIRNHHKPC